MLFVLSGGRTALCSCACKRVIGLVEIMMAWIVLGKLMLVCVVDLRAWCSMHQVLYNKDDFFDSLSCDAIEGGRAERTKFSEQRKIDTEVYSSLSDIHAWV
jgi:hypothetical protein